ncbi:hypothetical protein M0R45_009168 [Rubus argutus]|uniref:Uncharacterized protein n=1 Tax=Rubus argutus TaxID=59490 RepID=A0AAW1Y3P6_RUBAR
MQSAPSPLFAEPLFPKPRRSSKSTASQILSLITEAVAAVPYPPTRAKPSIQFGPISDSPSKTASSLALRLCRCSPIRRSCCPCSSAVSTHIDDATVCNSSCAHRR